MSKKENKIKLSKWLDINVSNSLSSKENLIEIIETIADATIPIRGLLERGISSREIKQRMNFINDIKEVKNIYGELQTHEDKLTHSIILKAIEEADIDCLFVASEEAEPIIGNGNFGITIDPVDGSSNVIVNRTVGTIIGIYDVKGHIMCSFYVLYGIYTNLVLAFNGKVAEFILDTSPYSMTFYHYIYQENKQLPNKEVGGIRCLGGDSSNWSSKSKAYQQALINHDFKDRYSGSFVGDFHAILTYGGVYAYFASPEPKIRIYYEWLPLAFIIKTLEGEFYIIDSSENDEKVKEIERIEPLTKDNVYTIHSITSGGLLGSKKPVKLYNSS